MIFRRDRRDRLRTWIGRHELWNIDVNFGLWPLFSPLAAIYRKTLARNMRIVTVVGPLGKTTTARAVAAGLDLPENPRGGLNASSFVARALLRIPPRPSLGPAGRSYSETNSNHRWRPWNGASKYWERSPRAGESWCWEI
jgi:hypothetical protein